MKKIYSIALMMLPTLLFAQNDKLEALATYTKVDDSFVFYDLDFVHCDVGFTIGHMGISQVSGSFSTFEGAAIFDLSDPETLSTTFRIDVGSINTNQTWRDKDLQSKKWFDKENYPYITFQSTKSVATEKGLILTGDLTMKGVTKEVDIAMSKPSTFTKSYVGYHLAFNGSTVLNRKDFGVGEDTWWNDVIEGIAQLEDSVEIDLSIIYQFQSIDFIRSRFFKNETELYNVLNASGLKYAINTFDQQKEAYESLPESNDDDFDAITAKDLITVSQALTIEGRYQEAIELLQHNMKCYPEDDQTLAVLGNLFLRTGQLEKAKEFVEKSLTKSPDNPLALELKRHLPEQSYGK